MRLLSKGGKALRGKALQGCRKVQKSVGGTANRVVFISALRVRFGRHGGLKLEYLWVLKSKKKQNHSSLVRSIKLVYFLCH